MKGENYITEQSEGGLETVSIGSNTFNSFNLFQESWWLDAVALGQWSEVRVESGAETLARWPYVFERRQGLRFLGQPPLTPFVGPWIAKTSSNKVAEKSAEKKLLNQLTDGLPAFDAFSQNFEPEFFNFAPLYWRGFDSPVRYTYRFGRIEPEKLWDCFHGNTRQDIRKAEKAGFRVRTDFEIDAFDKINLLTFDQNGLARSYGKDLIAKIDRARADRDARRIFIAEDQAGCVQAGMYLVYDSRTAFYLMGGTNKSNGSTGAMSLLLWHAIQFASKVSQTFDFEGSMIESIERYFRSFGADQIPYLHISKQSRLVRAIREFKRLFGR